MSEKSLSCVLCDAKLDTKEALQEHFRQHANKEIDNKGRYKKPPPVQEVKRQEIASTSTKVNKEEANEKIACDVCPLLFDTVTSAIQHKFRKHPESNVKHFCGFCGMQFPLKFTHDKHLVTHSGTSKRGDFPCPDCGVLFYNMGAQNYHIKSIHKRLMALFQPVNTPPPSKKIKINNAKEAQSAYYCYLCGQEYIIKFNLQKHLERSHTAEERDTPPQDLIKCTTCDALFYNKKAYENHNMYHKSDDLYVTSEEQRLQTVSRVDQDFDIRRVQLQADKFIPIEKPVKRRNYSLITKKENKTDKSKANVNPFLNFDDDDDLSPTSSIDSSDSEYEPEVKVSKVQLVNKNNSTTPSTRNSASNVKNGKTAIKSKSESNDVKIDKNVDKDIVIKEEQKQTKEDTAITNTKNETDDTSKVKKKSNNVIEESKKIAKNGKTRTINDKESKVFDSVKSKTNEEIEIKPSRTLRKRIKS